MSWEVIQSETKPCACGKGILVAQSLAESGSPHGVTGWLTAATDDFGRVDYRYRHNTSTAGAMRFTSFRHNVRKSSAGSGAEK
jgi:hypothetical protein